MTRRRLATMLAVCLTTGCTDPAPTSGGVVEAGPAARLAYEVYGSGKDTAVVLHGGPGLSHDYLLPALEPLLPGRTLIFYDQRGRGHSTGVDTLSITPDSDVEDLEAVRKHFRLDRMRLIGHHWGAAVAGLYAVRHPEHVERILMLSPFVVHPSFIYEFGLLGARGTDRESATAAYRAIRTESDARGFCRANGWWYFLPTPPDSPLVSNEAWRRFCDAPGESLLRGEAVKRAMLRSLGYWSWRTGLEKVTAPVLVIEGQGPDVVDDAARRWAEHLPHARLLELAPPHLFPWLGDPVAFRRAAEGFLAGGWPAGSEQPPPFDQSVAAEPQR